MRLAHALPLAAVAALAAAAPATQAAEPIVLKYAFPAPPFSYINTGPAFRNDPKPLGATER